jgi:hypothetical protein
MSTNDPPDELPDYGTAKTSDGPVPVSSGYGQAKGLSLAKFLGLSLGSDVEADLQTDVQRHARAQLVPSGTSAAVYDFATESAQGGAGGSSSDSGSKRTR